MGFGDFLDFNGDGTLSSMERAAGFAAAAMIMDDIEREEREESLRDDLLCSGLDETDLWLMDDDERAEALESAGLDPDDYDDFDW